MAVNTNDQSFNRKLITILLTAAGLWAIWYLHEVILLVFLSVIIAIGISLPAKRLERYGLGRGWATGLSVAGVTILFLMIILWLVPLLAREVQSFVAQLPQLIQSLQIQFAGTGLGDILQSLLQTEFSEMAIPAVGEPSIISRFVDNGLPIVFSGAGVLISIVTNLLAVLVVAVMLLINPKSYVKALLYVVPRSTHESIVNLVNKIYETIRAWLKSISFSILFTGLAVYLGMLIIGVPNPAAVALFAGFATFIPNIGALIPIIPIALFTLGFSIELFVLAVVVYLGIQLIESNIVTPAVVNQQLDIPVAGILIFQIIAGVLFGLLGVLLAVPLLATIITVVKELVARLHYHYKPNQIALQADSNNHLHLVEEK